MTLKDRRLRTSDAMWEALNDLAERNGRSAAEEARIAIEAHLATAANTRLDETRRTHARYDAQRQHDKMKDANQ